MTGTAGNSSAVSPLGLYAALLFSLATVPACGGSDSDSSSDNQSAAGSERSNESLTPSRSSGNTVNPIEVRLSLTIAGTPVEGSFGRGTSSSFGGYFQVRFADVDTGDAVLDLGFTDAVTTGTYPLAASVVELASSEARVTAAIRHEAAPRPLYVAGSITLDAFDVEDPSSPFALIEGSFEGTVTTPSGSEDVEGEFFQESACRANPGNRALGC